ncbi:MAG: SMC-Scp complex subunit ScpB, partial [Bacillota bacterium]|nr:SMC-Scp complex subunit ScpB [Bacillota bacterium]
VFYANRGFFLAEIAGGYQFMTPKEMYPYVERLYRPKAQNLSKAAMETLAVIAYCQPVTRGEIEHIRGVNADGIVAGLLEKGLIDEVGRKDTPGKPVLYGTNDKFLQLLGLNSLEDLPQVNLSTENNSDEADKLTLISSENEVESQ